MKSAERCADFARVCRNAAELVSRERSTTAQEVATRLRANETKFAHARTDRRLNAIQAAQRLGEHTTQSQTADYIRHKKAIKAKASR